MGNLAGDLAFDLGGSTGDSYKAKLMRRMLPPPYNRDYSSVIGALITVIGQSDNLIGGLFGTADFLPDEV